MGAALGKRRAAAPAATALLLAVVAAIWAGRRRSMLRGRAASRAQGSRRLDTVAAAAEDAPRNAKSILTAQRPASATATGRTQLASSSTEPRAKAAVETAAVEDLDQSRARSSDGAKAAQTAEARATNVTIKAEHDADTKAQATATAEPVAEVVMEGEQRSVHREDSKTEAEWQDCSVTATEVEVETPTQEGGEASFEQEKWHTVAKAAKDEPTGKLVELTEGVVATTATGRTQLASSSTEQRAKAAVETAAVEDLDQSRARSSDGAKAAQTAEARATNVTIKAEHDAETKAQATATAEPVAEVVMEGEQRSVHREDSKTEAEWQDCSVTATEVEVETPTQEGGEASFEQEEWHTVDATFFDSPAATAESETANEFAADASEQTLNLRLTTEVVEMTKKAEQELASYAAERIALQLEENALEEARVAAHVQRRDMLGLLSDATDAQCIEAERENDTQKAEMQHVAEHTMHPESDLGRSSHNASNHDTKDIPRQGGPELGRQHKAAHSMTAADSVALRDLELAARVIRWRPVGKTVEYVVDIANFQADGRVKVLGSSAHRYSEFVLLRKELVKRPLMTPLQNIPFPSKTVKKAKDLEATRAKILGGWLTAALKISRSHRISRLQLLAWCGAQQSSAKKSSNQPLSSDSMDASSATTTAALVPSDP